MPTPSNPSGSNPDPTPPNSADGDSARAWLVALALSFAVPRAAGQDSSLAYKYQLYSEADDRIRVTNHNVRAAFELGSLARLSIRGVVDTITGATPTGEPAPAGSDQVPLARLEDERTAVVVDASRTLGTNTLHLEYARSREDDYVSNGYAATWTRDFNAKNTQLQLGFAYNDDRIQPAFFPAARSKVSRDVMLGMVQLLDRSTVLTVNLSHGTADGYLSDPYKIVQKTVELLPGFPLALTFPENRPGSRDKTILFTQLAHQFESLRGSAEVSCRYYTDSHGIASLTIEGAWFHKIGEHLVVNPLIRYYRQTEADYYHVNLDTTSIEPESDPTGSGPHYSSDYRLSSFQSLTLGMKVMWRLGDRWTADVACEHYAMHGRDGETPESAYISANIYTAGISMTF